MPDSSPIDLRHEIRRIKSLDNFQLLRGDWHALAESCKHLLCMTYFYNELAASHALANGAKIEIIMVYNGPDLVAMWPFAIKRIGPLRVARSLTCGNREEYSRPLVRFEPSEIYDELVRAACKINADVLQLSFIEDDTPLARSLSNAPQGRWLRPTTASLTGYSIRFEAFPAWQDYEVGLSKALRDLVRRRQRQLSALGQLEIGWCRTPFETELALIWLFRAKRTWVDVHHKEALWLQTYKVRDFYLSLAHQLDLSRTPLVAVVKLDNVFVAATVAPIGSHTLEWAITTYNQRFSKYSPGLLLANYLIRWAYDHHLDFDFRPLDADYKVRWSTHATTHRSVTLFLSPYGRLASGLLMLRRLAPKRGSLRPPQFVSALPANVVTAEAGGVASRTLAGD